MKGYLGLIAALALGGLIAVANGGAVAGSGEAHAHLGHVMTGWNDTPEGKGLLPVAIAEADIAAAHARLAAQKPGDLAWMKTHTGHVMHAVDPSQEASGPGLGYGVKKATEGVILHIGLAAESADATDNIKTHQPHVATSAANTLERVDMILELGRKVKAAQAPALARRAVEEIEVLVLALREGIDADGDGSVSWKEGEGGLDTASQHMGFIMQGVGLE